MRRLVLILYLIMLIGVFFDTSCAIQLNCESKNPNVEISNFGGRHTTTVNPNNTTIVTVNCTINCTNVDLNNCSIEANAYIIVPSDGYSTYKVCPRNSAGQFNRANYGVTASCSIESRADICVNRAEEEYTIALRGFRSSDHKEFVIICGLTPSTIIDRETDRISPVLSLAVNGLYHKRAIIKVQDIPLQLYSDQIDHHPVLDVDEGRNVTLTCTKTYGSIAVWKFVRKDQSNNLIEILFPMDDHNSQLQAWGININASEGYSTDSMTGHDLQNFSITFSDVQENLTSTAIYCGARVVNLNGTLLGQKFHSRAAILVVHKVSVCIDSGPSQLLNAGEKTGISVGVIALSVLIIVMIVLLSGGQIHARHWRPQIHPDN